MGRVQILEQEAGGAAEIRDSSPGRHRTDAIDDHSPGPSIQEMGPGRFRVDLLELLGPVDRYIRAGVGDERLLPAVGDPVQFLLRRHAEQGR